MTVCSIFGDEEFERIKEIRGRLLKQVRNVAKSGARKFLVGQFNTFDIMSLSVCSELSDNDSFIVNCVCSTEDRFEKSKVFVELFFGVGTCVYENEEQHDPIQHTIKKMIDDSDIVIIYFNERESSEEVKFAYEYARKTNTKIVKI